MSASDQGGPPPRATPETQHEEPKPYTGGTGKYEGASGGGTYMYESLTDTLTGGTYQGKLVLP